MSESKYKIVELPEFDLSQSYEHNLSLLKSYFLENGTYTEKEFEEETKKIIEKYSFYKKEDKN